MRLSLATAFKVTGDFLGSNACPESRPSLDAEIEVCHHDGGCEQNDAHQGPTNMRTEPTVPLTDHPTIWEERRDGRTMRDRLAHGGLPVCSRRSLPPAGLARGVSFSPECAATNFSKACVVGSASLNIRRNMIEM